MKNLVYCCLFLVLFHLIAPTAAVSRASYGEPCSHEVRCDSRKFLACSSSGQCDCLMSNSMIFNETLRQCVTLAGERCEYTTVEGDRSWSDVLPCIHNAACNNGICECADNHFEVSNGTCYQKRTHGQDCIGDDMCQEKIHLVCGDSQKCSCRQNRVFRHSYGECVLRAGEPCNSGERCTEFSDCSRTCNCRTGYFQSDNGTCEEKRYVGQLCEHSGQCKDVVVLPESSAKVQSLLKCLEGKCKCDPSVATEYSSEGHGKLLCGKRLNMPCSRNEGNNCIKGAHCNSATEMCTCVASTHFPTERNLCEPRRLYDQPCSEDSPCDYDKKRLNCSLTTKTCVCAEGTVIDLDSQECRGSPGTQCTNSYGTYKYCVPNAYCNKNGACQCVGNTMTSPSRKDYCFVVKGDSCNSDINQPITSRTCLPGLLCSNQTCTCPYKDFQAFNPAEDKCVSRLDGPCNTTEDCTTSNTVCVTEIDGSGPLQCRCKSGYISVRGTCQIAFGEKCSKRGSGRNEVCDSVAPLECSSQGICECVRQQVYDNQTATCRGLVGAQCDERWRRQDVEGPTGFCVEGAYCKIFRGSEGHFGVCKCRRGLKTLQNGTCQMPIKITNIPLKRGDDGLDDGKLAEVNHLDKESSAESYTNVQIDI